MKPFNLRFVFIILLYGGIVFLCYRDEVLGTVLAPLEETTAIITSTLLRWCAIMVTREGTVLSHPDGFSYKIAYICTGFLPSATFVICIFAFPGAKSDKFVGILCGVPSLLFVNYLRLANLFYIGVYFPESFKFAHELLWEAMQVIFFITLWLLWIHWATGRLKYRRSLGKTTYPLKVDHY